MNWDGRILADSQRIPLADESVHCAVTSVPYYGLRSYKIPSVVWGPPECSKFDKHRFVTDKKASEIGRGNLAQGTNGRGELQDGGIDAKREPIRNQIDQGFCECGAWRGQLGSEPQIELYVEHIVQVFREVKRVLRADGSCWMNVADTYAAGRSYQVPDSKHRDVGNSMPGVLAGYRGSRAGSPKHANGAMDEFVQGNRMPQSGLKPKDLCLVPYRIALALQADGWWVRSEITQIKPAPMPESISDRPTSATEKIFLLTKAAHYFYDRINGSEPTTGGAHDRGSGVTPKAAEPGSGVKANSSFMSAVTEVVGSRNMRNWWLIAPEPLSGEHYAAYPTEIPRRAISIGTSDAGCCGACGAPLERILEKRAPSKRKHGEAPEDYARLRNRKNGNSPVKAKWQKTDPQASAHRMIDSVREARDAGGDHDNPFAPLVTLGWKRTCKCETAETVPCTILDPFLGSGSSAIAAERLGRRWIGLDLGYHDLQKKRLKNVQKEILF